MNREQWPARAVSSAGTIIFVALAAAIVVPPLAMPLLLLSVAATEYSPLLALATLGWMLVARRLLRGHRVARRTSTAALCAAVAIACWPLARFNGVARLAAGQLGVDDAVPRYSLLQAFRPPALRGAIRERAIAYRAADGTPLTLRLYRGALGGPRPTVVVIYGGAWRGGDASQGAGVSRALAARGFTVAAIDYRHAPAAQFPAQLDDVRRSLALVHDSASSWGVDTARIALLGRSAGAHLAELAAWTPGGRPVQGVIAIYSPFDLVRGYTDLPSPDPIGVRAVLRDFLGGAPAGRPAQYAAASPATWVRCGLPPTLLLYGARDHVVKPAFNRAAAARLRAVNAPVVAVEIPWAEHGFDLAPGGLGGQLAFAAIVAFLERQLE